MKALLLDIETSPNVAYVWSLWRENIPLTRLIESSEVLCFTAKWLGSVDVVFDSIHCSTREQMLSNIHRLLDEADVVIHYNGNTFDIPVLNKEFITYGFSPPAPFKQVDLYKVVRSSFRFVSNKLAYIVQRLGLGEKIETSFDLWVKCMGMDDTAWEQMEEYNRNDVALLERLYIKLRPWIKNHPNYALYQEVCSCPQCGSTRYHKRGFSYTKTMKYQRYQCQHCHAWFRSRSAEKKTTEVFTTAA